MIPASSILNPLAADVRATLLKVLLPRRRQKVLGRCYELAYLTALEWEDRGRTPTARLVHGTIIPSAGPYAGTPYPHAWVEIGGRYVFDSNIQDVFPLMYYYGRFRAKAEKIYRPRKDAAPHVVKAGHFGPWHTGRK